MLETHQTHHVKLFNPIIVIYESLAQVKEFKYLGVLFASEGTMEREIGRRIRAAGRYCVRFTAPLLRDSVHASERSVHSSSIGRCFRHVQWGGDLGEDPGLGGDLGEDPGLGG